MLKHVHRSKSYVSRIGKSIARFFCSRNVIPEILELGSKDGYNTNIIYNELKDVFGDVKLTATDELMYLPKYYAVRTELPNPLIYDEYKYGYNTILLNPTIFNMISQIDAIDCFEDVKRNDCKYVMILHDATYTFNYINMNLTNEMWEMAQYETFSSYPIVSLTVFESLKKK